MPNQNNRDEEDNCDVAFEAVSNSERVAKADGKEEEVGVVAHGFGQDFEMELTITYRRRHPSASPSMRLDLLALPIEFSWRSGEGALERMERLNQFMDDKAAVARKEEEAVGKMPGFVQSLQDALRKAYDARDATCEFKVDLEGMAW